MTLRVYGRSEYAEPLVELGPADEDADVRARYDGEWVELVEMIQRGRLELAEAA